MAVNCSIDRRCGSDLVLLWLWCRLAAAVPVRPQAWELHMPQKKKKKKILGGPPLTAPSNPLPMSSASLSPLQASAGPFLSLVPQLCPERMSSLCPKSPPALERSTDSRATLQACRVGHSWAGPRNLRSNKSSR